MTTIKDVSCISAATLRRATTYHELVAWILHSEKNSRIARLRHTAAQQKLGHITKADVNLYGILIESGERSRRIEAQTLNKVNIYRTGLGLLFFAAVIFASSVD